MISAAESSARWRARNPEKVRAQTQARRESGATAAAQARYRELHPERVRESQVQQKENRKAASRRWRQRTLEKDPDYMRAYFLRTLYGMSLEEFDRKLVEQGDACAIYKQRPEYTLGVDHDHVTGAVRGLLCRQCNRLVADIENQSRLEAAVGYLRQYGAEVTF